MKKWLLLPILFLQALVANAATDITTATVSGHWTISGSPYRVFNNVSVADSLIIEPGVTVEFQGHYSILTSVRLCAIGTSAQPITFTVADTTGFSSDSVTLGGWAGITFTLAFNTVDSGALSYCNFEYLKSGSIDFSRKAVITHCDFKYCREVNNSRLLNIYHYDTTNIGEVGYCNFFNIESNLGPLLSSGACLSNIHDCTFHNNKMHKYCDMIIFFGRAIFRNNSIYENRGKTDTGFHSVIATSRPCLIEGNKIYDNVLSEIGAVSVGTGPSDINRNYICNNKVTLASNGSVTCPFTQGGGAIHISDVPYANMITVRNNVIANNFTQYQGGGIYLLKSSVSIYNNQFVNNSSQGSGAIYVFNESGSYMAHITVKIKNNIFYNNICNGGTDTFDVQINYIDTFDFAYNWMQKPVLRNMYPYGTTYYVHIRDTSNNIVGTDPGLTAPTTTATVSESALAADFSLLPTSGCIDMGENTIAASSLLDYAGLERLYGPRVDIGAIEYHPSTSFINSTSVANEAIKAYPNPATNMLFITTPTAKGTVMLTDITGKVVVQQPVDRGITYLDMRTYKRGIYILTWEQDGKLTGSLKVVLE